MDKSPERKPPVEVEPLVGVAVADGLVELVPLRKVLNKPRRRPVPLVDPVPLVAPPEVKLVRLLKRSEPILTPIPNKVARKDLWVEFELPPNSSPNKDERELLLNKEVSKLTTEAKSVLMIPLFFIDVNKEDQLISRNTSWKRLIA